jgi:hypothetical protein
MHPKTLEQGTALALEANSYRGTPGHDGWIGVTVCSMGLPYHHKKYFRVA